MLPQCVQEAGFKMRICTEKLMAFVMLALSGCSLPRTSVIQPLESPHFKTFAVTEVAVGKTFADSTVVASQRETLVSQMQGALSAKGYVLSSAPESTIAVFIHAAAHDATSPDNLRFMKGAHGSNFPSADPRVRSLESDHLEIRITDSSQGRIIYAAKCRLLPEQDTIRAPGVIDPKALQVCVEQVLRPLPGNEALNR